MEDRYHIFFCNVGFNLFILGVVESHFVSVIVFSFKYRPRVLDVINVCFYLTFTSVLSHNIINCNIYGFSNAALRYYYSAFVLQNMDFCEVSVFSSFGRPLSKNADE